MCGIAGIYRYGAHFDAAIDRNVALRMVDSLVHRGPDDGGLLVTDRLALGHRRLSILDVSDRGRQPMCDVSGRLWVAFNGEIYNFREIRRVLEGAGYEFRTRTDTEVILHGYRHWGMDCVKRFNGMFAFALWDWGCRRLWMARDPLGVKPLFYHDDGATLHFGSEIKALLADPDVPRQPDLIAMDDFLTFAYTPAPRTGFEGIRQLLPGHALIVENSTVHHRRYFDWPYPTTATGWDEKTSMDELRAALDASVRRQMVSDVPIGAFLSGGVDSSAVVCAMRRHTSLAPRAFCVGFKEASFDESPNARAVAAQLGVDLHVEQMTPQFEQLLMQAVSHAEEPLADNSMLAVFLLCQATRPHVKVALSGDGADELLAGYATYRASRHAASYRRLPTSIRRRLIAPLVSLWPSSGRKYALADCARRFVAGAEAGPLRDHCSWRRMLSDRWKEQLYSRQMWDFVAQHDPLDAYVAAGSMAPSYATGLERQLLMDVAFHLPNDMLVKVDRMSMAHSLEVRVPLLDLEMVQTCLGIPPQYKLRGKCGKYVLKRVLESQLPRKITRRKKAGFVLPIENWLAGQAHALLREHVMSSGLVRSGWFSKDALERMINGPPSQIRNMGYELFTVLVLSIWWSMWIEQSLSVTCVRPKDPRPTRLIHFLPASGSAESAA